jgi:YfiH family protein
LKPSLLVPDWPAPPGVRAACSTREGGVSLGPHASLNLGDHVGDDEQAVAENRRRFLAALDARPVFMKQVHGAQPVELTRVTDDGVEADACFTHEKGVACTIMVADCLPVLLADTRGRAVAAAHAGWRGLAAGVIDAALRGLPEGEAIAWLGPCIGPAAFEVGAEVKAEFESRDAGAAAFFKPLAGGKFLADLPGLARRRLQALGVTRIHGNDGGAGWCTVANPSRFFSYRRDRVSGRFAAAVWLA